MRHVDLFSGLGGFSLAAERAGFVTVLHCEIDPHCQAVLKAHWPEVPIIDDVREVHGIDCDIITGGFPCQDISVAGRRAGLAGERSGLWWEFRRILADVRPTWTVIENVPGLLSSNKGRDMGAILGALGELGYWWAYRVLDAQYCGVPQRRRRVFIVGCLRERCAAEVLLEPESLSGNPPPSREERQEIAGTLGGGSGERGWSSDTERMSFVAKTLTASRGQRFDPTEDEYVVSAPLTTRPYCDAVAQEGGLVVASPVTASAGHHGRSSPQGDGADNLVAAFSAGQGAKAGSIAYRREQSPTLKASASGTNTVLVLFQQNQRNEVREMPVAGALPAQPGMKQQNYLSMGGASVRRLTPLECTRLQGFPGNWVDGHSDSHQYRMLGNAVAVPVVERIMRRIAAAEVSCDR